MKGMIGTFESIANNPFSRLLLKKTMNYCEISLDGPETFVEVAELGPTIISMIF